MHDDEAHITHLSSSSKRGQQQFSQAFPTIKDGHMRQEVIYQSPDVSIPKICIMFYDLLSQMFKDL